MKQCIITLNSMTYAVKARDILSRSGINTRVVRPPHELNPKGCAFGLEVPDCTSLEYACTVLKRFKIPFSDTFIYEKEDDGP